MAQQPHPPVLASHLRNTMSLPVVGIALSLMLYACFLFPILSAMDIPEVNAEATGSGDGGQKLAKPSTADNMLLANLSFACREGGADCTPIAPGHDQLRAEDLYAAITIYYIKGPGYLEVKNSWLGWGKWVQDSEHLSDEVSSPDGLAMTAWGEYHIIATGRQFSPSGCDGTFDLYFNGNERAVYVHFDTNFLGTPNVDVETFTDNFHVTHTDIGVSYVTSTIYISWAGGSLDVVDA